MHTAITGLIRCATYCASVLLVLSATASLAAPPPAAITNIQPVQASAPLDQTYDPTSNLAFLYAEPIATADLPVEGYRLTTDVEVTNTGSDYLRLDQLFSAAAFGLPPVTLNGQELLELPESHLTIELGGDDLRRPMLTNGGFGVTGLTLEQRISKEQSLRFGEALDVVAYGHDLPKHDKTGYVIAGTIQSLVGDPPKNSGDPLPGVSEQGFLARYDNKGKLRYEHTTTHDEISALVDLGDGQIVLAGRDEVYWDNTAPAHLLISRVRFGEVDDDSNLTSLGFFKPDSEFGATPDTDGTTIIFHDGQAQCAVRRATEVISVKGNSKYVVAAELECQNGHRTGIAVLNADGTPDEKFGSGGMKVYSGPNNQDLIPVGIAAKKLRLFRKARATRGPSKTSDMIWLGAALGDGCSGSGKQDCEFALNAFDLATGALESATWFKASQQSNAESTRPYDFALDKAGRPVMGGVSWEYGTRFVAVHRFTHAGAPDNSFGLVGWYINNFNGHQGEVRAVRPTANGDIALAIMSLEDAGASGIVPSLGMARISGTALPLWESSPFADGHSFMHADRTKSLNYGYQFEAHMSSIPAPKLVEDWSGRLVTPGLAASALLDNPCAAAAAEVGDPLLDIGPQCGGPTSVALARYLPFGEPDSRRWIAPDEVRRVMVPEDRFLGTGAPSAINLSLTFSGYDPLWLVRDIVPFKNKIYVPSINSDGSYRFPFAPSTLNSGERFSVKTHSLDHHHRYSTRNRFAYDISVKRWTGTQWTTKVDNPEGAENADYLIWQRPVRALAPGRVIDCRRTSADTTPNAFNGGKENYVKIQHTYDPSDGAEQEFISYLHFAQDSVPESICPDICPKDNAMCDLASDGVDPDGAKLTDAVYVDTGDFLGLVGSSGNSSVPHLHIHLTTGADAAPGPAAGSYPLLFHGVRIQSDTDNPEGASWEINGKSIHHGSLVTPLE